MKLGTLMKTMATRHQFDCHSVTWPQIAAKGDAHYFVYKTTHHQNHQRQKVLSAEDRVQEIAKMIGGAKASKVALENAQDVGK